MRACDYACSKENVCDDLCSCMEHLDTLHSAWIACPPITVVFNEFARAGEMIDERLSGLDKAKRKRKEKKVNP